MIYTKEILYKVKDYLNRMEEDNKDSFRKLPITKEGIALDLGISKKILNELIRDNEELSFIKETVIRRSTLIK